MSRINDFIAGPVKVSDMRRMIQSGQFANWIKSIRAGQAAATLAAIHFMDAEKLMDTIRKSITVAKDEKTQV